jgi:hypothetical protein
VVSFLVCDFHVLDLIELQILEHGVEARERLLPELAVGLQPVVGLGQPGSVQTTRVIRPARSNTLRCLEMAGWDIAKGSANSVTDA